MIEKVTVPGPIALDQLLGTETPAQVVFVEAGDAITAGVPREPHRHDYHELFLVLDGVTDHLLDDGDTVRVAGGQALMIGRGQVHVLQEATGFRGAVVRFAEELLTGAAQEASPGWVLASCERRVLDAPRRELEHALAALHLLDDELRRPPDRLSDEIVAATLRMVLALVARWQLLEDAADAPADSSPDVELMRRFVRLLEAEHQRHHDAAWYAAQLHVSSGHLAAVLTRRTGRSTKRMITDRLMTEVARLLRFTDLTVQQVAHRLGYDDPLYLSRAFKAHTGLSPSAWREQRGGAAAR